MIHYYKIGDIPIKATCTESGTPIQAEIADLETQSLVSDLSLIPKIADDMDYVKIDKAAFQNACLALGIKMPK